MLEFTVEGFLRIEKTNAVYVIQKTQNGFTQRCFNVKGYNRDYVSNEKMNDLKKWLQIDFKSFDIINKNIEHLEF